MTFPTDSIQNVVSSWWDECDQKALKKGSLIFAFVPHVDQIPNTLIEFGRTESDQHHRATLKVSPLRIKDARPKEALPVAALSLHEGELWTAYRAKKRPCLVVGNGVPKVDDILRRDMPKKLTSPTILVAPYYGADKDGHRAGYNPELIKRIQHTEYPQFMLDSLPIGGPKQSILRFDHIQPIGLHYYAYEHSGYCLSEEAVELILDDWLTWVLYGGLPPDSFILDFQQEIKMLFG